MRQNSENEDHLDPRQRTAFTVRTRRILAATRVVAYTLASLFMLVMIVRGVWLTEAQLRTEADRSIAAAQGALAALDRGGPLDEQTAAPILRSLAATGLTLAIAPRSAPLPAASPAGAQLQVHPINGSDWQLLAAVDGGAIVRASWHANFGYIVLVTLLGIPVIVIFLQMGWLVNQPALQLLSYAQSARVSNELPPELPWLWAPVVERLRRLRESQAQMQAFLNNAPMPMAFLEPQGLTISRINRSGAGYFGFAPEELVNQDLSHVDKLFPDDGQIVADQLRAVRESKAAATFEAALRSRSGQDLQLLMTAFPVLDDAGEVQLVGWIMVDVTEERQAQQELTRSAAALHQSEKLAALGSMLAGVSHELNNPLAAVIGQAAMLAEDLRETQHFERITRIRRAADRCARIVQSFLAMARQREPDYRSVDVNDQIGAAIELTEYQMRAANVLIETRLATGLPSIEADPDQLHQVIVNLLTNARQALEDWDGERRIIIETSRAEGMVRIAVTDSGKGIPDPMRDRIFDPFFTTKAPGSGTGIGLSYSLGIVAAHGGTLAIEDVPQGSCFVIMLPISETQSVAPVARPSQSFAAKGRVLVIDDEVDVAETLADMLKRSGLDVEMAIGGRAAQDFLAQGTAIDLVLSDIRMPECDGPTMHTWIGHHRPELAGRLAFVTGDTLSGKVADFLAEVDCPVLEKPFTPAALRELIQKMLAP
ncbi:ATP-binding protein [Novosphingobium sp.]|uniref:hybrid sensor histidine kinase/response regulator n=1 Tax=Novosphingobium sp. TaxID=1874826 RepID=UPI0026151591|nr:ATP-binding protein [Novosphingobium sp.]